jgi:hypothetical protein
VQGIEIFELEGECLNKNKTKSPCMAWQVHNGVLPSFAAKIII